MYRHDIIRKLAVHKITSMERIEKLETVRTMQCEDWEIDTGWEQLPDKTKEILLNTDYSLKETPDEFLNPAIKMEIENHYLPVTNSYLIKLAISIGVYIDKVEGCPAFRFACPCCGSKTIENPGDYDICGVCWWEDDGQDNKNASQVWGGPNEMHSLTQARVNYIKFGISCPDRADLVKLKEPAEKYEAGRVFYLTDNEASIAEKGTTWKVSAISTL